MKSIVINPLNYGAPSASLTLPAIMYKSGKRVWYAFTIPYKTLGKLVHTSAVKKKNQEIIKAEIKNRFLDSKHKKEIEIYIKEEEEFTIPPITLTSYEKLTFIPVSYNEEKFDRMDEEQLLDTYGSVMGMIIIPLDYEFECLDGNHRTAAIRELANSEPHHIIGSSMLLNVVYESRPRKIRQDFVDVNKNAKQTTSSINTLFNTRDKLAKTVADTIDKFEYLTETTELLASSISANSKELYTLNNIKNAILELDGYDSQRVKSDKLSKKLKEDSKYEEILSKKVDIFFTKLSDNNYIKECINSKDNIPKIRQEAVITSGAGLAVIARLAGVILNKFDSNHARYELDKLMNFDWSRSNAIIQGKLVMDSKIQGSREAMDSTTEAIKMHLGYN